MPHGALVAAIADGAGSAALADLGASAAVRAAVDAVRESIQPLDGEPTDGQLRAALGYGLQQDRAAVVTEAAQRAVSSDQLATTLIVLVATPVVVAAAQVGDGAAVLGDPSGSMAALTVPQSGEYANETTFIVSPGALQTAQYRVWRGRPASVALFSDGLQMLALRMPQGAPHAPFFSPLFSFIRAVSDPGVAQEQLAAFLKSPRVAERTDDDLTLLLAALVE